MSGKKPYAVTYQEFSPDAFIDALREAGLTPRELAEETGVSQAAIGRWMSGEAVPRGGYLNLAARVLGIEPESLLVEVEEND